MIFQHEKEVINAKQQRQGNAYRMDCKDGKPKNTKLRKHSFIVFTVQVCQHGSSQKQTPT